MWPPVLAVSGNCGAAVDFERRMSRPSPHRWLEPEPEAERCGSSMVIVLILELEIDMKLASIVYDVYGQSMALRLVIKLIFFSILENGF